MQVGGGFALVLVGLKSWGCYCCSPLFPRIGVFFFVSTNQAFGSLGAVRLFITQKALFMWVRQTTVEKYCVFIPFLLLSCLMASHENASGYYRVSAFFISKIATDLIPLRFLPNLLFTVIIYFMIGLLVANGILMSSYVYYKWSVHLWKFFSLLIYGWDRYLLQQIKGNFLAKP